MGDGALLPLVFATSAMFIISTISVSRQTHHCFLESCTLFCSLGHKLSHIPRWRPLLVDWWVIITHVFLCSSILAVLAFLLPRICPARFPSGSICEPDVWTEIATRSYSSDREPPRFVMITQSHAESCKIPHYYSCPCASGNRTQKFRKPLP